MADSYPERRFVCALNRGEGILYIDTDRAERREVAEHWATARPSNTVYELCAVADMDALRALVDITGSSDALLECWGPIELVGPRSIERCGECTPCLVAAALDAVSPAFLATVKKP